jgi:hypothetical protein
MFKLLIRFLIIFVALILSLGFATAFFNHSIIVAIVFICAWVFVKPFSEIIGSIILFSILFDFFNSQSMGFLFLILFSIAVIFNFINNSIFEVSGKRILLAYFSVVLLVLSIIFGIIIFTQQIFSAMILIKYGVSYAIITIVLFFIFTKILARVEKFITFYTQKIDVKKHI